MNDNQTNDELLNNDSHSIEESEEDQTTNTKKKRVSQVQQLKDDQAALNDRLLRLMAEYENYRKRTEKEKQNLVSLGTSLALERILPVIDTLEIAANAESSDKEYKKGVAMTLTMFSSAISSLGITEIDALNKPFDPKMHNCVSTEESCDHESGIVLKVLQKGYSYGERIIRPASVSVSS